MGFKKLRELRDRFEQKWINGGFIFGYENEINENHNNDYPLLVVLPPTSELPATEGDVQEEYTFECLIVKPYYQNQAGSLDVVFSLLEQEALTWLQRVLDSYTNKEVILSPDSISVEREKELYNDKLIQVRLTFTLNAFSHSFLAIDEALVMSYYPKVWLKADMGIKTEFFGGNEVVNKWIDQSGNGNDFVQTESLKKPKYKYEEGQNGYPYLEFDGVDDFMTCINNGINDSVGLNSEHAILWVAKSESSTGVFLSKKFDLTNTKRFAIESVLSGGSYIWQINHYDNDNDELTADDGSSTLTSAVGYDLHNKGIHTFVNQTVTGHDNQSHWDTEDSYGIEKPMVIGSSSSTTSVNPFSGQIQEIIITNHDTTHENIQHIERYLQHKYNL